MSGGTKCSPKVIFMLIFDALNGSILSVTCMETKKKKKKKKEKKKLAFFIPFLIKILESPQI